MIPVRAEAERNLKSVAEGSKAGRSYRRSRTGNIIQAGIYSTNKFLELFFSNLLMGTDYELKNRYLHLDYKEEKIQTARSKDSNGKICLMELPIEEKAVLEVIIAKPEITQKEIASKIGKSERTVRNKITGLKEKGILERVNGKRNGKWEVSVKM